MVANYLRTSALLSWIVFVHSSRMGILDSMCPPDADWGPCYCNEQYFWNAPSIALYCSTSDPEWDLSATFHKICNLNPPHFAALYLSYTNVKSIPANAIPCSFNALYLDGNSLLESIDVNAFTATENTTEILIAESPLLTEGVKNSETDLYKFFKKFPNLNDLALLNVGITRIPSGGISIAGRGGLSISSCLNLKTIEDDALSLTNSYSISISFTGITTCGLGQNAFRRISLEEDGVLSMYANPRLTSIKESTLKPLLEQGSKLSIATYYEQSCTRKNNCYGYGLDCHKMTWFCDYPHYLNQSESNFHCRKERDPNYTIRQYCEMIGST